MLKDLNFISLTFAIEENNVQNEAGTKCYFLILFWKKSINYIK